MSEIYTTFILVYTNIRTATFDDKFNYLEDFGMQETA